MLSSLHKVLSCQASLKLSQSILSVCPLASKSISFMAESGPMETTIREKISKELSPTHLEIINESPMHNVPKDAESHFKVVIVSSKFEKQMPIKRHRMVFDILKEEMDGYIHALSLVTKTPEQWEASEKVIPKSPPCRGGSGL